MFVENVDANADKIRSVFPEESRNIFRQRDKMLEVSEDFIKLEEAGQEGVSSFARRGAGGAAASLVLSPQVAIPLAEASGAIAAWTLFIPYL